MPQIILGPQQHAPDIDGSVRGKAYTFLAKLAEDDTRPGLHVEPIGRLARRAGAHRTCRPVLAGRAVQGAGAGRRRDVRLPRACGRTTTPSPSRSGPGCRSTRSTASPSCCSPTAVPAAAADRSRRRLDPAVSPVVASRCSPRSGTPPPASSTTSASTPRWSSSPWRCATPTRSPRSPTPPPRGRGWPSSTSSAGRVIEQVREALGLDRRTATARPRPTRTSTLAQALTTPPHGCSSPSSRTTPSCAAPSRTPTSRPGGSSCTRSSASTPSATWNGPFRLSGRRRHRQDGRAAAPRPPPRPPGPRGSDPAHHVQQDARRGHAARPAVLDPTLPPPRRIGRAGHPRAGHRRRRARRTPEPPAAGARGAVTAVLGSRTSEIGGRHRPQRVARRHRQRRRRPPGRAAQPGLPRGRVRDRRAARPGHDLRGVRQGAETGTRRRPRPSAVAPPCGSVVTAYRLDAGDPRQPRLRRGRRRRGRVLGAARTAPVRPRARRRGAGPRRPPTGSSCGRSSAEGPDDLFIAEDSHQRIYGQKVVLGRYGIRIVGRSQRLRLNYRTTAQNLRYAVSMLTGDELRRPGGPGRGRLDYRSARTGPSPRLAAVPRRRPRSSTAAAEPCASGSRRASPRRRSASSCATEQVGDRLVRGARGAGRRRPLRRRQERAERAGRS